MEKLQNVALVFLGWRPFECVSFHSAAELNPLVVYVVSSRVVVAAAVLSHHRMLMVTILTSNPT